MTDSSTDPADGVNPAEGAEAPLPTRRELRVSAETPSEEQHDLFGASSEPPRKKKGKAALGCLVVFFIFLGLAGAAALAFQDQIRQVIAAVQGPADYTGDGTGEVIIMILDGDDGSDITNTLFDADVIASYKAFYELLVAADPQIVFQPGAYQLAEQMSAQSALAALTDPANKLEQTVVIPEGTAAVDVLQLMADGTGLPLAELQAAAADLVALGLPAEASTVEGFLFPATYTFTPGATAPEVLKVLVDRQFEALDSAGVAPADRWKTIVLASLIQREAGLRDDYYKVSRVFLNRLDPEQWSSGLLQSDATVAYGTGNTHLVTTTNAERADAGNLYNTYQHPGLPIGPISNPGDLAIDAALNPSEGSWVFFVTVNLDTGETVFSTTIDEHQTAVNIWLNWMDEHPEYG